jgi:hypothetical protein
MSRVAATPRRGIPALIKQVRHVCRRDGVTPAVLAAWATLDYGTCRKLLGMSPQSNLKKATEEALRTWLDNWRTTPEEEQPAPQQSFQQAFQPEQPEEEQPEEEQLQLDLEPVDDYVTVTRSVMEEVLTLLPLSGGKKAWLTARVAHHLAPLHSLISKLENELGDKDTQLIALQRASKARFDLGKQSVVMQYSGGDITADLHRARADNERLRAALKSITETL